MKREIAKRHRTALAPRESRDAGDELLHRIIERELSAHDEACEHRGREEIADLTKFEDRCLIDWGTQRGGHTCGSKTKRIVISPRTDQTAVRAIIYARDHGTAHRQWIGRLRGLRGKLRPREARERNQPHDSPMARTPKKHPWQVSAPWRMA